MNGTAQIAWLEQKINDLISGEPDLFLVELKIKPTNNIKVYIDGDQGVPIERLVQYNRKLYKQLEEENLYPNGDFSLEVSSPGLDEPLKLLRQYRKNLGRFVEVTTLDDKKTEGKLTAVTETGIDVEEVKGKGKKQPGKPGRQEETSIQQINFDHIKSTKIQIKF